MTARDDEPPGFFYRPRNIRWMMAAFHVTCAALLVADLLFHRHIAHPIEDVFGFHAFYGFIACWLLVVLAKQLRRLVMRGEHYHDG